VLPSVDKILHHVQPGTVCTNLNSSVKYFLSSSNITKTPCLAMNSKSFTIFLIE
jgi:hypothetical protein